MMMMKIILNILKIEKDIKNKRKALLSLIFIEWKFNDENDINNFYYDTIDKDKKICYGNLIPQRSRKWYFKRILLKDIYLILKRVYCFIKLHMKYLHIIINHFTSDLKVKMKE